MQTSNTENPALFSKTLENLKQRQRHIWATEWAMNQITLTNFVMMILVRNCWGCCMSLRTICSLSVQSLKHLRKKKKKNSIPRKASKIVCDHKTQHNPTNRSREKRGAHALEFVRSAAKRNFDSRAFAPPRQFAQLSATYWPHQTLDTSPFLHRLAWGSTTQINK